MKAHLVATPAIPPLGIPTIFLVITLYCGAIISKACQLSLLGYHKCVLLFTCSWKQSSPDLQNQSRLNPSVHPSGSRVMSLHSELFKNHVGSSTSFFNQTGYPANNSNVSQAVDGGFSKDCLGQTWCPSPWSSGDRTGLDWDKRLRDPPNDMDISLPHSSNDAAWRYRTASDSGGLSPTHKRAPVGPSRLPSWRATYQDDCFHIPSTRVSVGSVKHPRVTPLPLRSRSKTAIGGEIGRCQVAALPRHVVAIPVPLVLMCMI